MDELEKLEDFPHTRSVESHAGAIAKATSIETLRLDSLSYEGCPLERTITGVMSS